MAETVLIVGAGQAGAQAAAALRTEGFEGAITLIGDEPHLPYQRPPLSKGVLLGSHASATTTWRPGSFYTGNGIELLLGSAVIQIDRVAREIVLADGTRLAFDHLILATGTRPRRLEIEGAKDASVVYLRTLGDAETLARALRTARNVAVIGGGFIGLEVAASARQLGCAVTVLEIQSRLMARSVARRTSDAFRDLHLARGVAILLKHGVTRIEGGHPARLVTEGGAIEADLILVGVGATAHDELAADAGLETANGILVDESCRTADPGIYAIGDCAIVTDPATGRRLRLESVQNAIEQGRAVAARIMGRRLAGPPVPWFWSDQFDVKLQIAGGADSDAEVEIVRGDPDSGAFSVFRYAGDRLAAVDSINAPADHLIARRLLASSLSPDPGTIANPETDLRALTIGPGRPA